jgi:dihydrofolate reductase
MHNVRTPIAIVAAIGRNGAIGREGRLPWTMPGDLARFRDLTLGKPMIMGRRTFDSIGRALPGRETIVVSRNPSLRLPDGAHLATTPEAALALADVRARAMGAAEISLIGGSHLFNHLLGEVDRLYMTIVDLTPDADTFLPPIDPTTWQEVRRWVPSRHPGDEAPCVFVDYLRRTPVW